MEQLSFRRWTEDDLPALWDLLYLALYVLPGQEPMPREVLDKPDVARYLTDFGDRPGDDAQVCVDSDGRVVGAAWCRLMPTNDPGYGFVADDVPELSMAVDGLWQGQGVGRRLLDDLVVRHSVMSLSVDAQNTRAVGLYRSAGFQPVDEVDGSITMLRNPEPPGRR